MKFRLVVDVELEDLDPAQQPDTTAHARMAALAGRNYTAEVRAEAAIRENLCHMGFNTQPSSYGTRTTSVQLLSIQLLDASSREDSQEAVPAGADAEGS